MRCCRSAAPPMPAPFAATCTRSPARHDADLGGEQQGGLDSGPGNDQPLPQGMVIVGIDGGYVRNWYDKKRNFEVIVGKSMAAMTGILASSPARMSSLTTAFARFCRIYWGLRPSRC